MGLEQRVEQMRLEQLLQGGRQQMTQPQSLLGLLGGGYLGSCLGGLAQQQQVAPLNLLRKENHLSFFDKLRNEIDEWLKL